MNNYGYIRVASCSPEVKPGDIKFNISQIIYQSRILAKEGARIIVFPELSVTGYTCGDLFGQSLLVSRASEALCDIASELCDTEAAIVVGLPIEFGNRLFNCAAVLFDGEIRGLVPKNHIPNYGEFYERRWFSPASELPGDIETFRMGNATICRPANVRIGSNTVDIGDRLLFELDGIRFGIEICEDLWVPEPPSGKLAQGGADIILNLSATNELTGKHKYLIDLIRNQSARCRCAYVYSSAGTGESSTDLAFAGNCIIAENGSLLAESERFVIGSKHAIADVDVESLRHDRMHFGTFSENSDKQKAVKIELSTEYDEYEQEDDARGPRQHSEHNILKYRTVKRHPFLDDNREAMTERCDEISSIQAWGLATRLRAINCKTAVVGISGGLDSTLALLVTVKAFDMLGLDRKGITGITMPGFGTTDRTRSNADKLMELLGVTLREIPIGDAVKLHFEEIAHDPEVHDVTYENSQARERTQILMDVANQVNGLVIGTGDLSELALGWCTYNGDQMSMYGVNASIPKTLVKYLVRGYADKARVKGNEQLADVLEDIINTPISPELLPPDHNNEIEQKTEDLVGPYELHDFFLYHMLRFGMEPKKIILLAKKAFNGDYDAVTIRKWLKTFYRRFFSQQFKRSCMPDGIKAGSVCLSPRGDWRMPSDASAKLWLDQF